MARISRTTRTAQTGWRVFITPGWVITFLLVISFSYAAFTILSPWQLGKDAQIVNRNNHRGRIQCGSETLFGYFHQRRCD